MSKFKDFDSLLNSYQQLEKKFTQKCQELKQIGTSDEPAPTAVEPPPYDAEEFFGNYPNARQYQDKIMQSIDSPNGAADKLQYMASYIDCLHDSASSDNSAQQCTSEVSLGSGVADALPTIIAGNNGNMSLALPSKPKTISEASMMAQKIFD